MSGIQSNLNTFQGVQEFLKGRQVIDQIAMRSQGKPSFLTEKSWSVCDYCRYGIEVVLRTLATMFFHLGYEEVARQLRTYSLQVKGSVDVYSSEAKTERVAIMKNKPSLEARQFNNQKERIITDPALQKRLFNSPTLKFEHDRGICRGTMAWFFKLYLATESSFSDPRAHVQAVAKIFEKGGPQEAVLLQSLWTRNGKILGLNTSMSKMTQPIVRVPVSEFFAKEAEIPNLCFFDGMAPGVYKLGFPGHACGLIKISDQLYFFIDPNKGVTEIRGNLGVHAQLYRCFHKVIVWLLGEKVSMDKQVVYFDHYLLRA